jgi:ribonuclease HI
MEQVDVIAYTDGGCRGNPGGIGGWAFLYLLQRLDELIARQRVSWEWVRAHAGERGNERVDQLANAAMDRIARGVEARAERRRTWKLR